MTPRPPDIVFFPRPADVPYGARPRSPLRSDHFELRGAAAIDVALHVRLAGACEGLGYELLVSNNEVDWCALERGSVCEAGTDRRARLEVAGRRHVRAELLLPPDALVWVRMVGWLSPAAEAAA